MHIPSSMLNGAVCPVTMAVGAAGVAAAAVIARQSPTRPSLARFAAVSSLIFALQMLNFPVQDGTSGHLLGAVLAAALLGAPFAVLAMTLVLGVQAFFFGDGGISALGANVINMGLLGAGGMGMILNFLRARRVPESAALALASWGAVMLGAAACALEVAWAGAVPLGRVWPAMLAVHARIGIGEAVLTVGLVSVLSAAARTWSSSERTWGWSVFGLAVLAVILSPLASSAPDGLEWVAGQLSFIHFSGLEIPALFPDYQVSFMSNAALATILAGGVGVGLVTVVTMLTGRFIRVARA